MSGRKQHEDFLRKGTLSGLEEYPPLLTKYFHEAGGSQQSTKRVYVNQVKRFYRYLVDEKGMDFAENSAWKAVSKRDIKDYFLDIKTGTNQDGEIIENKAKTMYDYRLAINNLFEYLVFEEIVPSNPCPSRKELKGFFTEEIDTRRKDILNADDVHAAQAHIPEFSKAPARDLCIFTLACRTALFLCV